MPKESTITARIDSKLKLNAENILKKLGVSHSEAITMLYNLIVLHKGLPFLLRLPAEESIKDKEALREYLEDYYDYLVADERASNPNSKIYSADEVKEQLGL